MLETNRPIFLAVCLMAAALAAGIIEYGCQSSQQDSASNPVSGVGELRSSNPSTGNGAPSGPHYDLNIIGVPKGKTADMTGDNGHRIFVPLDGSTKILLSPGDFQVLDANGTDGSAAFQLPVADSTNSGTTTYSVYARALGKPGGNSSIKLCGVDSLGTTVCSGDSALFVRVTGKSKFVNVTQE